MANFGEHLRGPRGPQICPLCSNHLDNQQLSLVCPKVKESVEVNIDYSNIFQKNILAKLFHVLEEIESVRKDFIEK